MSRGVFITFEGIEGSGKSTQYARLVEEMTGRGYPVLAVREPGGTRLGDKIRSILLDPSNAEMTAETEALLYAASRSQLVDQVVDGAIAEGKIVICDRFLDSSIAYQVYGRGLTRDFVVSINKKALGRMPDITFLLDIEAEAGLERATKMAADRIEREEIAFHRRVREGYLKIALENPGRVRVLDGTRTIEDLSDFISREVEALIANKTSDGDC